MEIIRTLFKYIVRYLLLYRGIKGQPRKVTNDTLMYTDKRSNNPKGSFNGIHIAIIITYIYIHIYMTT